MYEIVGKPYVPAIRAIGTGFAKEMYVRCVKGAKVNKVYSTSTQTQVGVSTIEVADIPTPSGKRVSEEISEIRWGMLGFQGMPEVTAEFPLDHVDLLYKDYLLASSLCYVEEQDEGKLTQFLATKNRFIVGALIGKGDADTVKYKGYLAPLLSDYMNKQLRVMRIGNTKKGYKIAQARENLDLYNKDIRVVPVYLMDAFIQGYKEELSERVLRFGYLSEGGAKQELVTTLNPNKLLESYDKEKVTELLQGVEYKVERGEYVLPDLEGSQYSKQVMKSLPITRVISVEEVTEVDRSFLEVDLDSVVVEFIVRLSSMVESEIQKVGRDLTGGIHEGESAEEIRQRLELYVNMENEYRGEGYRKELHRYMVDKGQMFGGYTGESKVYEGKDFGMFG